MIRELTSAGGLFVQITYSPESIYAYYYYRCYHRSEYLIGNYVTFKKKVLNLFKYILHKFKYNLEIVGYSCYTFCMNLTSLMLKLYIHFVIYFVYFERQVFSDLDLLLMICIQRLPFKAWKLFMMYRLHSRLCIVYIIHYVQFTYYILFSLHNKVGTFYIKQNV